MNQKKILLIDDICTTGSTFESIIVELKKQGNYDEHTYETIPPLAQCIILYKLENDDVDDCLKTQNIAEKFGVSYATANRTLRWLSTNNILSVEGGKEKKYIFTKNAPQ